MTEALTDALENIEEVDQPKEEVKEPEVIQAAYIDQLVGDGKKYKSTDDLAKAYHHANLHIEELKTDLNEYKGGKELLNEVLNEIRSSNEEERIETTAPPQAPVETQIQTDDVAKIVNDQFNQREALTRAEGNVQASLDKLIGVYGSEINVKAAVSKAIGNDKSVKEIIDNLSRTNPDTMLKFITGIVPTSGMDVSNTPAINNSTGGAPAYEGVLTWDKCREVRKENPRLYKSAEFRKQMEVSAAEAAKQGVDFFAT